MLLSLKITGKLQYWKYYNSRIKSNKFKDTKNDIQYESVTWWYEIWKFPKVEMSFLA